MKLVVFGLSVSSSWGNGHATLWRGLIKALGRRGWQVSFFEKDVPYYRTTRDRHELEVGELVLYESWEEVLPRARGAVAEAEVAMVTSYCPDAVAATALVCNAGGPLRVFYDLDTPVTLSQLRHGAQVEYLGPDRLTGFDLVLSYTGGAALEELQQLLGARATAPLYGHVDPEVHRPGTARPEFAGDCGYIGTYAADRQPKVEALLLEPARRRPEQRFVIAGAQYPEDFPWTPNIHFVRHLPPTDHPDFYASSRLTLNVTRSSMAALGWCPSGRLFEAAACGAVIVTDVWPGLEDFFALGDEVLPARSTEDVLAALDTPDAVLARIAANARERVLAEHSSERRAEEFEAIIARSATGALRHPSLEGA